MSYDTLKVHEGRTYSGMPVGASHGWIYPNGRWHETKLAPDRWGFEFRAVKTRRKAAPPDTGARLDTGYHWYILADQHARKIDKDSYDTLMTGLKFKVGHRRPYWKRWSYDYPGQSSCEERVKEILWQALEGLER